MPYIYGLSNPAMPGLLKLGAVHINGKSVKDRIYELYKTGVPDEFRIEFFAEVEDSRVVERKIHSILATYRNNSSREFFRINSEDAKTIIEHNMPHIIWSDKDSVSNNMVYKSAYKRLSALYKKISDNTNIYIDIMKKNKYYESLTYDYTNENKCNDLLQRLRIIHDGLIRMNDKKASELLYRKIDNAYMKEELNSIQTDLENFKESAKIRINMAG
jgi:hypothetical protein